MSRRTDTESAYEVDMDFNEQDYESSGSEASDEPPPPTRSSTGGRRSSVYSTASTLGPDNNDSYLQAAENAMGTLQTLHSSSPSNWNRALKHRSGVVVYVSKAKHYAGGARKGSGGQGPHFNIFKGEHDIPGFNPAAVFGVVGTRKLWDDWYNEGNLVENLNDTTSLTYMSMKGVVGTSTRDLSLVERVAGNATGTILFVSTSVVTPKVPRVSGRVRASIALNGWVLEPINGGTRVTYYLHVNVKTFVPAFAAVKYLARRPTCIARIDDYLRSHGPPPMATIESTNSSERTLHNNGSDAGASAPRRRRDSTVSKRSTRSRSESVASGRTAAGPDGSLPVHVLPDSGAACYPDLVKGQKLFKALAASFPSGEWSSAQDTKGNKIWMKTREGGDVLPLVRGETLVEGVTTEMVLGTILSEAARREWDARFSSTTVVSLDNGFDQGVHTECVKAIFPSLGARHFNVIRGVDREDPSTDNGQILLISRSARSDAAGPKNSTKAQMDVMGWLIEDHSDRSVKVTLLAQLDVKSRPSPFVHKILVAEMARAPGAVKAYIDDHGYAPFFVRWGEGPAEYLGDGDSDLKKGRAVFKIGGEGQGTMANGQQKCWLQWSDKMYERGIDISISPAGAATVSRVQGMPRTVQFTWTDEVKEGGAKIIVQRARHGDGAEDVYLKGEYLDSVVAMDKGDAGAGGAGMAKRKVAKKAAPAPVDDFFDAPPPTIVKPKAERFVAEKAAAPVPVAIRSAPAPAPVSVPTPVRSVAATEAPAAVYQQGVRQIPEDAFIIISPDLYFTKSQCTVIAGFAFVAYLWGKFA